MVFQRSLQSELMHIRSLQKQDANAHTRGVRISILIIEDCFSQGTVGTRITLTGAYPQCDK